MFTVRIDTILNNLSNNDRECYINGIGDIYNNTKESFDGIIKYNTAKRLLGYLLVHALAEALQHDTMNIYIDIVESLVHEEPEDEDVESVVYTDVSGDASFEDYSDAYGSVEAYIDDLISTIDWGNNLNTLIKHYQLNNLGNTKYSAITGIEITNLAKWCVGG